jgi:hypothetical protein
MTHGDRGLKSTPTPVPSLRDSGDRVLRAPRAGAQGRRERQPTTVRGFHPGLIPLAKSVAVVTLRSGGGCEGGEVGAAGSRAWHLVEPVGETHEVHGGSSRNVLEMGLGQAAIAGLSETEGPDAL